MTYDGASTPAQTQSLWWTQVTGTFGGEVLGYGTWHGGTLNNVNTEKSMCWATHLWSAVGTHFTK